MSWKWIPASRSIISVFGGANFLKEKVSYLLIVSGFLPLVVVGEWFNNEWNINISEFKSSYWIFLNKYNKIQFKLYLTRGYPVPGFSELSRSKISSSGRNEGRKCYYQNINPCQTDPQKSPPARSGKSRLPPQIRPTKRLHRSIWWD